MYSMSAVFKILMNSAFIVMDFQLLLNGYIWDFWHNIYNLQYSKVFLKRDCQLKMNKTHLTTMYSGYQNQCQASSETLLAQLIVLFHKKSDCFSVLFFSKHQVISGSMLFSTKLHRRKANVIGLTYYFYLFLSNFHNLLYHQASLMQGNSFLTLSNRPLNTPGSFTTSDTPIKKSSLCIYIMLSLTQKIACSKSSIPQRICL